METNGDSWLSERQLQTNGDQRELLRLRETNGDSWESEKILEIHETNGQSSLMETIGDSWDSETNVDSLDSERLLETNGNSLDS